MKADTFLVKGKKRRKKHFKPQQFASNHTQSQEGGREPNAYKPGGFFWAPSPQLFITVIS